MLQICEYFATYDIPAQSVVLGTHDNYKLHQEYYSDEAQEVGFASSCVIC